MLIVSVEVVDSTCSADDSTLSVLCYYFIMAIDRQKQ